MTAARLGRIHILPGVVAGVLVAVVLVVGAIGAVAGGNDAGVASTPESSTASSSTAPSTETTADVPRPTDPTTTTIAPLETTLGLGSAGDDVRRVQQRLADLGFVPGGTDGNFGSLTEQSVWAFETLVLGTPRSEVTGRVTPETWQRLMDPATAVEPRRPAAGTTDHTEIYLPEQVLAVFHAQQPVFVAHMSPGTGEEWCEEVTISPGEHGNEDGTEPLHVGRCGVSNTPGGVFEYHRKVDGHRESALGGMLNPVYFNYGIAVHGAYNVPNHPASHGCVRIPNALSERYQDTVDLGERVYVWDGEQEPEYYGDQPPTFDWPWEDYEPRETTTTSAPTTTPATTTTTTTPATTTTTAAPTTTTTTAPTPTTTPATTTAPSTTDPSPLTSTPTSGSAGRD